MQYKKLPANEVIFNIGDVGDYFYILVHGRVQLFLPNPAIQGVQRQITNLNIEVAKEQRLRNPDKERIRELKQ